MPSSLPSAILVAITTLVVLYTLVLRPGAVRSGRVRQWEQIAGETSSPEVLPVKALEQRLQAAGWNLSREEFLLLSAGLGIFASVAAMALGLPALVAACAGGAVAMVPRFRLASRERARWREVDRELPAALSLLVGNLRVQPDLAEALRLTALALQTSGAGHLADEFLRTAAEIRTLGSEAALRGLQARSPSPSLDLAAKAMALYAQVGGDFVPVLQRKAEAIRGLVAARQEAATSATDALLAGKAIPLLLAAVTLGLLREPTFGAFYRSLMGQLLLLLCSAVMALGYAVMKSMVEEVA